MSEYSRLMCVYGTVFMVMSGVLPASQIIIIQTKNLRVEYGTDLKRKKKYEFGESRTRDNYKVERYHIGFLFLL